MAFFRLDIGGGLGTRRAEARWRDRETPGCCLERIGAERLERVAKGAFRGRPRNEPADDDADCEDDKTTDERGDQQRGFDGHQYRTPGLSGSPLVARLPLPVALSRSHERQPRFRQLQLGGVQSARLEAGAERAAARAARQSVRAGARSSEPRGVSTRTWRDVQAFGLEACEPRPVDGLERQRRSGNVLRNAVLERRGRLECPAPQRFFAVAGEAERPRLGARGTPQPAGATQPRWADGLPDRLLAAQPIHQKALLPLT